MPAVVSACPGVTDNEAMFVDEYGIVHCNAAGRTAPALNERFSETVEPDAAEPDASASEFWARATVPNAPTAAARESDKANLFGNKWKS